MSNSHRILLVLAASLLAANPPLVAAHDDLYFTCPNNTDLLISKSDDFYINDQPAKVMSKNRHNYQAMAHGITIEVTENKGHYLATYTGQERESGNCYLFTASQTSLPFFLRQHIAISK